MKIKFFKLLGVIFAPLVLIQCSIAAFNLFQVDASNAKRSNNVIGFKESPASVIQKRMPSLGSNLINRNQQKTNIVGTGLEVKPYSRKQLMKLVRYMAKQGGLRRGYRTKRTVESPAISTDTGGRPSQKGIRGNIAKLFSSKPGYYSDIYDNIDFKQPMNSTKTLVEPVETLVRVNAIQSESDESQNSRPNPSSRHNQRFRLN